MAHCHLLRYSSESDLMLRAKYCSVGWVGRATSVYEPRGAVMCAGCRWIGPCCPCDMPVSTVLPSSASGIKVSTYMWTTPSSDSEACLGCQ